MENIKNLKEKAEHVLNKFPHTRNCDASLTQNIINEYMPSEVKEIDGKYYFSSESLKYVKEDNVKRLRAKIQNDEGRFLPNDESVRKSRKISEERWKNFLSRESARM